MRKVFKNLLYLVVGITFTLSGCSKDKNDDDSADLTGNYKVAVFLNHNPSSVVYTTLTVTKDGNNLKASGNVTFDKLGKIDLNLVLSSINIDKGSEKEGGISYSYTDAYYMIAKQKVTVGSKGSFDFQGIGSFEGFDEKDYDGGISLVSGAGMAFKELYFDIRGDVTNEGVVTISVEPQYED